MRSKHIAQTVYQSDFDGITAFFEYAVESDGKRFPDYWLKFVSIDCNPADIGLLKIVNQTAPGTLIWSNEEFFGQLNLAAEKRQTTTLNCRQFSTFRIAGK